jgi:hypothetical protein
MADYYSGISSDVLGAAQCSPQDASRRTGTFPRGTILAEVHRRITEQRNGHFHRSADGYSDPDSVVDALEDLASWITVLHVHRAKSAA